MEELNADDVRVYELGHEKKIEGGLNWERYWLERWGVAVVLGTGFCRKDKCRAVEVGCRAVGLPW